MNNLFVHPLLFVVVGFLLYTLSPYVRRDEGACRVVGSAAIWLGMAALVLRWCSTGVLD